MWTVDQTSYSGVDTSAVEDKVTNTDTSGTVSVANLIIRNHRQG